MRRTASEIIRNLERRVARLENKSTRVARFERQAVFSKQVRDRKRPKSMDITPNHSDFGYFEPDFDFFLRKERMSKDEFVLTHISRVARQSKAVPVTRSFPDGEEVNVLMAFYVDQYAPQENWDGSSNEFAGDYLNTLVFYFKYTDSLLAGGNLVNGELISVREAEKFIREAN